MCLTHVRSSADCCDRNFQAQSALLSAGHPHPHPPPPTHPHRLMLMFCFGVMPLAIPWISPITAYPPLYWFGAVLPTSYGFVAAFLYRKGILTPKTVCRGAFFEMWLTHWVLMYYSGGIFSPAVVWQPFAVQVNALVTLYIPSVIFGLLFSLFRKCPSSPTPLSLIRHLYRDIS